MFDFLWHDMLYVPLYNLLIFFYSIQPLEWRDMGLAVIFFTVFMRVVLLPFSIRAARSEHRMELIRPALDEIKVRYKYDLEKQREATKALLSKNKIGVFSSFVSLCFQLLVFVILYDIFSSGLQPIGYNHLYTWNLDPGVIESLFLGRLNLIVPDFWTSMTAAIIMFVHQAIRKIPSMQESTTIDKALLLGLPIGVFLTTIILPSAKALFLATSILFSMWIHFVRWIVLKYLVKDDKLKENIEKIWTS